MTASEPDPRTVLKSRSYLGLLLFAALLGVPLSAASYLFLQLVSGAQLWLFTELWEVLGFREQPIWWPVPFLVLSGVLVGLVVAYMPGRGGHSPLDGFRMSGVTSPSELPGIALAALATLGLGAVLGPEAPLIVLGGGLGAWAVRSARGDATPRAVSVIAATGSFAAISTLLGSPLLGAFLMLEAAGLAGPTASLVFLPGLLAAGLGTLIFLGMGSLTGLGEVSLVLPEVPAAGRPDVVEFGWAVAIGLAAAVVGTAIRRGALSLRTRVERRPASATPVLGLLIALVTIAYTAGTGKHSADVLFSGQERIGHLITHSGQYSVGVLLSLLACKATAYALSLSGFRGGPIFPAMFLGAVGGIVLSQLPGLPLVTAVATGIGAMCVTILRLPLTSVLLATLLFAKAGLSVMPLVIVAVVVAHVTTARLGPEPGQPTE